MQPEVQRPAGSGGELELIPGARFGAGCVRPDGVLALSNNVIVERILEMSAGIGLMVEALDVGVVVGKQQFGVAVEFEGIEPQRRLGDSDAIRVLSMQSRAGRVRVAPRPGIAKPDGGQKVKQRGIRAAVDGCHPDEDVVVVGLGVFDENVEITILIEDAGVD